MARPLIEGRRKRIEEMLADDRAGMEMAEALGISYVALRSYCSRHGIRLRLQRPSRQGGRPLVDESTCAGLMKVGARR
jgi:hypothetical protein